MRRRRLVSLLVLAALAGAGTATALGDRSAPAIRTDAAGPADAGVAVSDQPSQDPPSPSPSPARPSPTPEAIVAPREPVDPELAARIASIVERPDLQLAGEVGIVVLDQDGREVFTHRADRPLMPASTNKLLIAAGAMSSLGPDHRFVTRVVADEPIGEDGTVTGDLTIVGSGDPSLVTDDYHRWIYPSRPWASLDVLADRLVAAGLERVTGGIVGDAHVFSDPVTTARGWKDEYLADLNARHVTGLTVDAGLRWWIEEPPPDVQLEIHLADDPVRQAAKRLSRLLEKRGVEIVGKPRTARSPADPASVVLARIESPPLEDMLTHTMRRSDNHMADMLFVALGAAQGRGTWAGAANVLRQELADIGVSLSGLYVDDGSGLSRRDRVTPRQLAHVDAFLAGSEHARSWRRLMAVTGEAGTLEGRLVGTIAQGRFFGKTGTLDDVRALVGHAAGEDGRRYHLAVVANDLTGGDRWQAYVLMDELVLTLVAELEGCRLVAPSPAASPAEPYRSATRC